MMRHQSKLSLAPGPRQDGGGGRRRGVAGGRFGDGEGVEEGVGLGSERR